MLVIRLQKIGRKHQPSYRVVVSERRSKLGGPAVEDLGFYNSFSKNFSVTKERALRWLQVGAKPTPTVHNLFVKNGIVSGSKIKIRITKKSAEAAVSEGPKAEAVAVEARPEPKEAAA